MGATAIRRLTSFAVIFATLCAITPAWGAASSHVIASDTGAQPRPLAFWGRVECASGTRYSYVGHGGDAHLTAAGSPQGNTGFRRLTVLDGDDYFGERCELGENDSEGPTALYGEGSHLRTYFSERLPGNFPIATSHWQTVMQMKQAQPSHDADTGPALELQVREGRWLVIRSWHTVYSFPAKARLWTRFAWDVHYSKDPRKGWLQVSADLNGDGDFSDPGERSPVIHGATLATEISGPFNGGDGIRSGAAIRSHLRMGIYHDPSIPCPAPRGCSIGIDNVQVVRPAP